MTSSGSYLIWTAKPLFEGPGTYRQQADSDDSKESDALQLLEPQLPNSTTRARILVEDAMVTHTLSLSGIRPEPLCSILSPSSFSSPFIPNSAPTSMSRDAQSLPTVAPDIDILLSQTSRLPDELLGEIFHEYVLSFSWGDASNPQIDPSKRQFAPLSLMRICSRWRDVCISTPKLWVYHYIPMLKPGQQLSRFTSLKLGGEGNMDRYVPLMKSKSYTVYSDMYSFQIIQIQTVSRSLEILHQLNAIHQIRINQLEILPSPCPHRHVPCYLPRSSCVRYFVQYFTTLEECIHRLHYRGDVPCDSVPKELGRKK